MTQRRSIFAGLALLYGFTGVAMPTIALLLRSSDTTYQMRAGSLFLASLALYTWAVRRF